MPKKQKLKMFILIPLFTLVATFFGSLIFSVVKPVVLLIILGILAILYSFRLILVHFKEPELNHKDKNKLVSKVCGLFGPLLSGFSIGLVGTSLKPLKIPFAIRIGKMNAKKVYIGNTITTFFSSMFAIMWHFVLAKGVTSTIFYNQLLLGAALWTSIHYFFEITNLFFINKWRKPFQIIIGVILLFASIKVFMLI